MTLLDKLEYLMEEKGINNAQLSKGADIPYTTVDGFFKKGMENVKLPTLRKLANYFGCSLDYLVDDEIPKTNVTIEFNDKELEHIKKYRQLNDDGKEIVDLILEREHQFLEYRKKIEEIKKD